MNDLSLVTVSDLEEMVGEVGTIKPCTCGNTSYTPVRRTPESPGLLQCTKCNKPRPYFADWAHCRICESAHPGVDFETRVCLTCTETSLGFKPAGGPTFQTKFDEVLQEIREVLLSKNKQYGDSALQPMRVFSSASTLEQLHVRMDDKLSRIVRGQGDTEDSKLDLLGYLIIERIALKND